MLKQIHPQPLTGIISLALGGVVLVSAWRAESLPARVDMPAILAWLFLIAATLGAAQFQIHLRHNTKLMVITLPLYLIAVLFPPWQAALGAGIAMFGVSLLLRPRMGTNAGDIMTGVGRWIVVAWLGSFVAHLPAPNSFTHLGLLLLAAAAMFVVDLVGTAFEIAGISNEPPRHLLRVLFRELYMPEGVQYLLGIAGAIAAQYQLLALPLLAVPSGIVYFTLKRAKELQENTRQLLQGLADTVDLRDPYTGGHSRRVSELVRQILYELSLQGQEVELIVSAARVHDIGKVGLPDEILRKPGCLTPDERKLMETHVDIGAQLLQRFPDFARGKEMVRHHHERWDGKGYPDRLREMEIPLGARVIAVADGFDAMTSDRPYRPAYSVEKALDILREGRGTQWDPRVVDAFLATRTEPMPEVSNISIPSLVPAQRSS